MKFELQFPTAEIPVVAQRYRYAEDTDATEAGRRISRGEYSLRHLEAIFRWKTKGRGISRLKRNSLVEVADALQLATAAKTERAAMAVLVGLYGVQVPVASAVLTAINPKRYTIIDFRALEALGVNTYVPTIDFYLSYLTFCRELASRCRVDLRTLDRALWQWSKERATTKSLLS